MKNSRKQQRIKELLQIISRDLITVENGAEPRFDEAGKLEEDFATCGRCGMRWNDALVSQFTPAPSARCPYEYIHAELAELKRLSPTDFANIQPKQAAA